jgi:protein-S-isoprenylcysteine O-methyltransferase Ste14
MSDLISLPAAIFTGWTSEWPTAVLAAIWLAWLGSWVIASLWSGQTRKQVLSAESLRYRLPIYLGGILFTPGTAKLFGGARLWAPTEMGVYAAVVVTLAGIAFTWWGRIHLGRFWSNTITHKEGHHVIDTGPYALVRHPIYTGLITGMLATGLAVGTITAILGAILISFGMWQKARIEEVFLADELGAEAYGAYCRKVPRIVPFLRPG